MCDFLNLIVSTMMAIMDTVEDMYSLSMYGTTQKFNLWYG